MITIVKYSEKSIALFGETKKIKEELKSIGAKFNRFLKDPENEDSKLAGWILSAKKLDIVIETLTSLGVEFENKI
ncbi:MAG: hypothetical protein HPY57_14265 [Ignavibacteria bacterium]|nr:hypothetical protein [Ignavibacteria bacterium]